MTERSRPNPSSSTRARSAALVAAKRCQPQLIRPVHCEHGPGDVAGAPTRRLCRRSRRITQVDTRWCALHDASHTGRSLSSRPPECRRARCCVVREREMSRATVSFDALERSARAKATRASLGDVGSHPVRALLATGRRHHCTAHEPRLTPDRSLTPAASSPMVLVATSERATRLGEADIAVDMGATASPHTPAKCPFTRNSPDACRRPSIDAARAPPCSRASQLHTRAWCTLGGSPRAAGACQNGRRLTLRGGRGAIAGVGPAGHVRCYSKPWAMRE